MSRSRQFHAFAIPFLQRGTLAGCLLFCLLVPAAFGADDLLKLQQTAIQQAAAHADPSIVRIETVGGVDLVGEVLTGTGPTSGVVVRADGYIITSSFNFASQPASILVTLPGERRLPAQIVASDLSKMLTLLKVEADDLTPLEPVPREEIRVGETAIALGRTFSMDFPNVSVGIISALDRIWGRALQTDAKTSPVNYGGALVDLTGRGLGVIVPLSPEGGEETAGVQWYDSGIGFAIPMTDIEAVLDRMIAGDDLKRGIAGFGFGNQNPFSADTKVVQVRPESPADQAGIQAGDQIVAADGTPVTGVNALKQVLGRKYAGDVLHVTLQRGDETIETDLTLTDELLAYEFPYLGIQPSHVAAARTDDASAAQGVVIRMVFPESPAQQAGIQPADCLQEINGESVATAKALREQLYRLEPGDEVELKLLRGDEAISIACTLATYPDDPPTELPPEAIPVAEKQSEVPVGRLNEQLPNQGLGFWVYVPENYRADVDWGMLVWLHPSQDTLEATIMDQWSEFCRQQGFLLVGPRAGDVSGWSSDQEPEVQAVMDWVRERYHVSNQRVAIVGQGDAAPFGAKVAFRQRDQIQGLVLCDGILRSAPPETDPDEPLQLALLIGTNAPEKDMVLKIVEVLRGIKYPTSLIMHEDAADQALTPDALDELSRWLDALDRL